MSNQPTIVDAGINGNINEETGLEEWSVVWWAPDRSQAKTVGETIFEGVPLVNRAISPDSEGPTGSYRVTLSYRGLSDEGASGGGGRSPVYSFTSDLSKEPIEKHPRIKELIEQYGGQIDSKGKVTFPLEAPEGIADPEGATGFSLAEAASGTSTNPLYGWKEWLVFGARFNKKTIRRAVPDSVITNINKIVRSLPGGFPTPEGRDWKYASPNVSTEGNAYGITEVLVLSPPGGWKDEIEDYVVV